ncbi:hypothetical protein RJ639_020287 [Escallonia herrerae]|uniref:Uncharacterized protein n=1 Tax=Escallonia herrerae TaxID=1293975 RepID=A0AA88V3N5_9ASTE|nr:hypothetical protein RJ639_020287 [Escallonia herrerae]
MGDDVQVIDASSQPCFQPFDSTNYLIDCELFDIADKDGVGAENHEGDFGLILCSNGSDKMPITDKGEMQDDQECGDLDVVPFEYNEGETCDGEHRGDFEECSE